MGSNAATGRSESGLDVLTEVDKELHEIEARLDAKDDVAGAVLIRLSEVKAEKVTWLWPGRIPFGKLSILDGDPGLGKSLITVDLAARVTKKSAMPDGSASDLDAPAGVVICSAEDDPGDTIRPRFDAAGGNASRVVLLQAIRESSDDDGKEKQRERSVTLRDLPALEAAINFVSAKLVVIDPVMAYVGETDAHRDSEIRGLLAPLARLAAETGAAILLVRHLRKTGGVNPLYAGGGSIGIIGAVRSGMIVALDPDDQSGEARILAQTKRNLAQLPASLKYSVMAPKGDPVVVWGGTSEHDAHTLLAAQGEDDDERGDRSTVNEAVVFLRDLLAHGPVAVREAKAAAGAACITAKTLRNAKDRLGVKASKGDFSGGWAWTLPGPADLAPPPENEKGHLRAPSLHSAIKRIPREEALSAKLGTLGGEPAPAKVEIDEDIPF